MKDGLFLLSGTATSQILFVLFAPIITRIYGADNFGVYALYSSTLMIIGSAVTARYSQAIILAIRDSDSSILVLLCFMLTALLAFLVTLGAVIYIYFFNKSANWVFFLPFGCLATGILEIYMFKLGRAASFQIISSIRVAISMMTVVFQLFFGLCFEPTGYALIGAQVSGQLIVCCFLVIRSLAKGEFWSTPTTWIRMKRLLVRYQKFPLYSLPTDITTTAFSQFPVYFFSIAFGAEVVGYYALTERILGAPFALITVAILEIFRQRASEAFRAYGQCREIFIQTFWGLTTTSALCFAGIFFFGPELFTIIFGGEWRVSGHYAQILSVLFFVRFITSPLSYLYYLVEKQREDFYLHLLTSIVSIVVILWTFHFTRSVERVLYAFSAVATVSYLVFLFRSYQFSKGKKRYQTRQKAH